MKKESQQNQSRWWIWYHNAVWGIRTCLPRLHRKARRKPNLKVTTYLWARWISSKQERREPYETDHHPAIVSSESVDRQVWWDPYSSETSEELLNKPTKIPNPNQKWESRTGTGKLVFSDFPEWLQEFREIFVDGRVPEHRDSHAISSHELPLGPHEECGFGLTLLILTSRKTEIARSARGPTKITRAPTYWQSRTSCRKFWWFDYRRSQSSQWRLWISKQSSICSRGARLGHPMDRVVSVQDKKLLRKHKGACKSSRSRMGSLKSFTLTIPWNLAKPVKIFPGSIPRPRSTDRKQMGLLRERYAEWKKVRLQYCCNQVWMKNGG